MDVRQGEKVESELTYFTERRHDQCMQSEGEKAREELWHASVRAYNAREGEDQRQARLCEYHEGQARRLSSTLEALATYHEAGAERYRGRG